jgi:hypothetical protein
VAVVEAAEVPLPRVEVVVLLPEAVCLGSKMLPVAAVWDFSVLLAWECKALG